MTYRNIEGGKALMVRPRAIKKRVFFNAQPLLIVQSLDFINLPVAEFSPRPV